MPDIPTCPGQQAINGNGKCTIYATSSVAAVAGATAAMASQADVEAGLQALKYSCKGNCRRHLSPITVTPTNTPKASNTGLGSLIIRAFYAIDKLFDSGVMAPEWAATAEFDWNVTVHCDPPRSD